MSRIPPWGLPLLALLLLSACTKYYKTPVFSERHQLQPGVSDRAEVLRRLGKPEREAEVPRHMLAKTIVEQCMTWDQPTLKALVYVKDYLRKGGPCCYGNQFNQETHVYLGKDGKVCGSGSWFWYPVSEKWLFTTEKEY